MSALSGREKQRQQLLRSLRIGSSPKPVLIHRSIASRITQKTGNGRKGRSSAQDENRGGCPPSLS